MFTGIIEETGVIERIRPGAKAIELTLRARACARGLKVGASVAVNGCCLTVVKLAAGRSKSRLRSNRPTKDKLISFDLLRESWERTSFKWLAPGNLVNLERSLRAGSEMGGHFVTGHVDGLGQIIRWEKSGADWVLDMAAPPEVMRYVVFKGSIAVNGISLTVAAVEEKSFRIWIIPHTYEVTDLRERKVGDWVNLECDLLGKYVEKFVSALKV